MTLLFFDGCQDAVLVPKPEFATGSSWSGPQLGRDGSTNGAAQANNVTRTLVLPSSAATCIFGCGWFPQATAALANNNMIMGFCTSVGVVQTVLTVNSSGFIEVRKTSVSGTLLGTTSGHAPFAGAAWRHVAAKCLLHTSTGTVTVQVDGVTVLTLTGQANSTVIGPVTHINMAGGNGSPSSSYWDDIYVCDIVDATATQGRTNNDFLGDLRIQTLYPTSAGDTTGWTPSTGTNFGAVDETPPNQTDFVSVVATSTGTRDLYNLTDLTGTVTAVYALRVGLYAVKTDAGAATIKPVTKELTSGTVTADPAQALAVSYGAFYGALRAVKAAGTLWSSSDVNGVQAGVEVG